MLTDSKIDELTKAVNSLEIAAEALQAVIGRDCYHVEADYILIAIDRIRRAKTQVKTMLYDAREQALKEV